MSSNPFTFGESAFGVGSFGSGGTTTPTSITTDPLYYNAYGIITDAMINVGKLRNGGKPDPDTLRTYMRKLNKLINFYQTQGLKLWLLNDVTVNLTANQALYTFGPTGTLVMLKPLRVDFAYYLDTSGTQRPLIPMGMTDYKMLSQVSQPGAVNSYYVDKQQSNLNVYFWNTPDTYAAANGSAHLLFSTQIANFINLTDQMNFPIEWGLLLEWGLADQISTGAPAFIVNRAKNNAEAYREMLENWDVEDAPTSFAPDPRGTNQSGRFR